MKIKIFTTGGTIEKTYDETDGSVRNVKSVLDDILIRFDGHVFMSKCQKIYVCRCQIVSPGGYFREFVKSFIVRNGRISKIGDL